VHPAPARMQILHCRSPKESFGQDDGLVFRGIKVIGPVLVIYPMS